MKLRRVKIKNFRCLVDIDVPIDDTTILIGENNAGKTAFLDALRIIFSRGLSGAKRVFDEFDFYMEKQDDTPETSPGIEIELSFYENVPSEWSDELLRDLLEITQIDSDTHLSYIILRIGCAYDTQSKAIASKVEFLNIQNQPLAGSGAKSINNRSFADYIRLFYLASLRDPNNEFSPRSQFWGQILKDLNIDADQQAKIIKSLEKVNDNILKADPRLDQVVKTLDKAQNIMDLGSDQSASVQALPMTPWELLSRADVVVKDSKSNVKLPIQNHGQGIQSLVILFLFEAYIQIFLKPNFKPDTEAILELEEPEAHLHPQAIRALSKQINQIQGQKLISTHSPYFVQEVPLEKLRLFKRCNKGTDVYYVKRSFSVNIGPTPQLEEFCQKRAPQYNYSKTFQRLSIFRKMTEDERRDLLQIIGNQGGKLPLINRLFEQSQTYIPGEELLKLQNYVSRSRGDILFSRVWLLCEGQSEYILLRYFSELLSVPFDQSGVSIIDFQNNGNLGSFILLARAFDIKWMLTCDNDDQGKLFVQVAKAHIPIGDDQNTYIRALPKKYIDLEQFMFRFFASQYLDLLAIEARLKAPHVKELTLINIDPSSLVLSASGDYEIREGKNRISRSTPQFDTKLSDLVIAYLRTNKVYTAQLLVEYLCKNNATEKDVPAFYKKLIIDLTKTAGG